MVNIQHAVWHDHRFPLSYRDVQELFHQRGIQISYETSREWCIKFSFFFTEELRQRGFRWHLDEMHMVMGRGTRWLWRAMDELGAGFNPLIGEYGVPEVIHTDQLRSYGTAVREIPRLINVDHRQVIRAARCKNLIKQRAGVATLRCRDG